MAARVAPATKTNRAGAAGHALELGPRAPLRVLHELVHRLADGEVEHVGHPPRIESVQHEGVFRGYLERGYVLLYSAWQGDVPKSNPARLTVTVPVAKNKDGSSITGPYRAELVPAAEFYPAEPEHQDYLQRIPWGYPCHFPRPNWKLPRRSGATS